MYLLFNENKRISTFGFSDLRDAFTLIIL